MFNNKKIAPPRTPTGIRPPRTPRGRPKVRGKNIGRRNKPVVGDKQTLNRVESAREVAKTVEQKPDVCTGIKKALDKKKVNEVTEHCLGKGSGYLACHRCCKKYGLKGQMWSCCKEKCRQKYENEPDAMNRNPLAKRIKATDSHYQDLKF